MAISEAFFEKRRGDKDMKHLLSIESIGRDRKEARENIVNLILRSLKMIPICVEGGSVELPPSNRKRKLFSLFTEASTRTSTSSNEAGDALGMRVASLIEPMGSSLGKGESCTNTVRMLDQNGATVVVVRSAIEGLGLHLARMIENGDEENTWVRRDMSILVGGAGTRDHPSQVLLDLLTIVLRQLGIRQMNKDLSKLKEILAKPDDLEKRIVSFLDSLRMAFVGDLLHSRVVHDWLHLGRWFDIQYTLIAPPIFQVESWCLTGLNCRLADSLEAAEGAQYLYSIRLQLERLEKLMSAHDAAAMVAKIMITNATMERFPSLEVFDAQPIDARHPAISSDIWAHHRVIAFMQSFMGPPMRMGILTMLDEGRFENPEILVSPRFHLKPADVEAEESIAVHRERIATKVAGRKPIFYQVSDGTVIDRLIPGTAAIIGAINRRFGLYDRGGGSIVTVERAPSATMGTKEMVLMHGVWPPYHLAAIYGLVAPDVKVIYLKEDREEEDGKGYKRVRLPLPATVENILPCPNANCVTNHDPEAETFFRILGDRENPGLVCAYCRHHFSAKTVIDAFRRGP